MLDSIPDIVKELFDFLPKFDDGRLNYKGASKVAALNVVLRKNGKFLFMKRNSEFRYGNCWHLLSGYYDELISLRDLVFLELSEECGFLPEDVVFVGEPSFVSFFDLGAKRDIFLFTVILDLVSDKEVTLNFENEAFEWVSLSDLDRFKLIPGVKERLLSLDL